MVDEKTLAFLQDKYETFRRAYLEASVNFQVLTKKDISFSEYLLLLHFLYTRIIDFSYMGSKDATSAFILAFRDLEESYSNPTKSE